MIIFVATILNIVAPIILIVLMPLISNLMGEWWRLFVFTVLSCYKDFLTGNGIEVVPYVGVNFYIIAVFLQETEVVLYDKVI